MAAFRGYTGVDLDRESDVEVGPLPNLDLDIHMDGFDNLAMTTEDYDTGKDDGLWTMPAPHDYATFITDFNMRHPRARSWPWHVHLCHAVRETLPNLETLHFRGPTACCSLFHAPSDHPDLDNDPNLPKMHEVIINLVMPHDPIFARKLACHCITAGTDLGFSKAEIDGSIAAIDM